MPKRDAKQERLNFVCIVADQLRFDLLGCAGHPVVKTPNIDRLAENGVRFDRCYTIQPMCMATRSTWFTGRTPRGHGVRCNGIPLRQDIPTMPEALRHAGYRTHSIGKIHLNPWMHNMPPSHLDGTIRVPSVWHCPKNFGKNVVNKSLVSHLDFAPTILDLAGVPIPEGDVPPRPEAPSQRPPWPGKSFAAVLKGEKEKIQDAVTAENDADYLGLRQRTVITVDWHLTCYTGEEYGELFDLKNDPQQLYNLWKDPDYKETKRDLQILLMERFAATDSTLPRRMGHA